MAKIKLKKKYNGAILEQETKHILMNKFYNIFMNSVELKGLTHEEEDYVLRKLWSTGTISAFSMNNFGVVFAPYSVINYGLYDTPTYLQFINERNIPGFKLQGVNGVDCCIGFINRNHKPVKEIISFYVDKMTEILMSIYINTQSSKLPFLITVSGDDIDAANDVISNIFNNELAIFMNSDIAQSVSVNPTGNYIIDKLWVQYQNYLGECLTELGVDNNSVNFNRVTVDQVNSNNELINIVDDGRVYELKAFFDKVKELFGKEVTVESKHIPVDSVHEDMGDGKYDMSNRE